MGFFKYVRSAFLYHWNLLVLGSLTALGFISGRPDVVLPVTIAGELVYLALLSSNKRYQDIVDGLASGKKDRAASKKVKGPSSIVSKLGPEDRKQFNKLYSMCMELKAISEDFRINGETESFGVTELQMENVNRLLWIYLKLLYTKTLMDKYFRTINKQEILDRIGRSQEKLKALDGNTDPTMEKHRKALRDTIKTSEKRLANYESAVSNHNFIELELDRLQGKITSIAEMGINRQESEQISSEIDIVSSSVLQTEQTMKDLESFTGYTFLDEEPPQLLAGRRKESA